MENIMKTIHFIAFVTFLFSFESSADDKRYISLPEGSYKRSCTDCHTKNSDSIDILYCKCQGTNWLGSKVTKDTELRVGDGKCAQKKIYNCNGNLTCKKC